MYEHVSAPSAFEHDEMSSCIMYNRMVFPLYAFLNVLSEHQIVQKTLDKEYNEMVSLLYEFLSAASDLKSYEKTSHTANN